jgi:hypothetical protein
MPMTAKAKREAQAQGAKYGCHCDLDPGMSPDGCVKDTSTETDCIYAKRHRTREGCKYWQEITSFP